MTPTDKRQQLLEARAHLVVVERPLTFARLSAKSAGDSTASRLIEEAQSRLNLAMLSLVQELAEELKT